MRLIDADALIKVMIETMEALLKNPKMDNQEAHLLAAFHTVGKMIEDAKTVDAVSVVRCKDCKWSERTDLFLLCGAWDARAVDDNDFCSSGERRSE